jgi:hypothetical protein
VQRVRREGQLVGYLRPQALAGTAPSPIASTQAYREMLAITGGPAASDAPSVASPSAGASSTSVARLPYAAR